MAKVKPAPVNQEPLDLSKFPADFAVQLQRTVDELRSVENDGQAIAVVSGLIVRLGLVFPDQLCAAMVTALVTAAAIRETGGI